MTFYVSFEGDYELTVDEIWPDGDAPENPTPADVAAAMSDAGPLARMLVDWNLMPRVIVTGEGDGIAEVGR